METTLNKVRAWGVDFVGKYGKGNAQTGGFNSGQGLGTLLADGNPVNISNFFVGIGGPNQSPTEFEIGGNKIKINSVNALIKAIANNTATNVLATPQLLAMDNTEAEFEVGASVPIINTNTTNGTVQTTTGKQEAKLSLKITPQINKVSRYVTLKINQSINDFIGDPSSATNGTGLATTIRSANTEIMAKDGDTIAMGGLLRDKEVTTFNKVPLLGDIPVLGWLFKSNNLLGLIIFLNILLSKNLI